METSSEVVAPTPLLCCLTTQRSPQTAPARLARSVPWWRWGRCRAGAASLTRLRDTQTLQRNKHNFSHDGQLNKAMPTFPFSSQLLLMSRPDFNGVLVCVSWLAAGEGRPCDTGLASRPATGDTVDTCDTLCLSG